MLHLTLTEELRNSCCFTGLPEDKENLEADETLEPPLCSCRMETPRNQDVVALAEGKCMAVEGVDGKVLFSFSHTLNFLCICHFLYIASSLPAWKYLITFSFQLPVYCEFGHPTPSPHTAEFMSKTDPEAGDDASVLADPVAGVV